MEAEDSSEPKLDRARHVKYWRRCVKTLLPPQYTGNDSNRMYLGFLMINALEILNVLDDTCSAEEKLDYINWIYHCQHPLGGFRAWPGTDFGSRANESNAKWDPANIPATYFALTTLLVLGDDLGRVHKRATLSWLARMQRADGSFGETIVDGRIAGGNDPRFSYCGTGIRRILRGHGLHASSVDLGKDQIGDIDIDKMVLCIRNAESFDGGIADEPYGEPHAGYTFCSLGALYNVGRLNTNNAYNEDPRKGPANVQAVLRWLAYRQTEMLNPFNDNTGGEEDPLAADSIDGLNATPLSVEVDVNKPACDNSFDGSTYEPACAGMNGRTNKASDTCYAWWSTAPMYLLGHPSLCDRQALRRFLLDKTQHRILGGFGKFPDDLPDIYHSYLGLVALGLIGCTGVKEVDASLCVSKDTVTKLQDLWKNWSIERQDIGHASIPQHE